MELNRACREEDMTVLNQIGPYARALFTVCYSAENFKKKEDKIPSGDGMGGGMAGCFLLWRGAAMKDEWIQPYIEAVGQIHCTPGNSSFSRNLSVALSFAFNI